MSKRIKSQTSDFTLSRDAKAKWLKALRSGRYKQAFGELYDGKGYCCIGVFCKTQRIADADIFGVGLPEDMSNPPPWADVRWMLGHEPLSAINDFDGLNFKQIADIIEAKVPTHD